MIFHITQESAWAAAQNKGQYEAASLVTEGFIHCSSANQVLEVAHRLFRNSQGLILLEIDPQLLQADLRYENCEGGAEQYPHIYGPIPVPAVKAVFPFLPNANGQFVLPTKLNKN